jgi:hypothetical protein
MILRRATKSVSLIPENNTKKMCFYKFVATLLLSLTHRTAKILKTNRLYQIKNILHRQVSGNYQRLAYIINDYQGVHFERLSF